MATNLVGQSNDPDLAGVLGEGGTGVYGRNITPQGNGVIGASDDGRGVWGHSNAGYGVLGESQASEGVRGVGHNGAGVSGTSEKWIGTYGESKEYEGVRGVSHSAHGGVVGINDWAPATPPGAGGNGGWFESSQGEGVRGWSKTPHHGGVVGVNTAGGFGTYGLSDDGIGVVGESKNNEGVRGVSHNPHGGVVGINDSPEPGGNGGWFESTLGEGIRGTSKNANHGGIVGVNTGGGIAVYGTSDNSVGVWGTSVNNEGIHAETKSTVTAAIAAYQTNADSESAAFFAKHMGNRTAGRFEGDVEITGHVRAPQSTINCYEVSLSGADCAENFDIGGSAIIEPGSVMVIDDEGTLRPCASAYDKKVGGVISGAGAFKPGITLGQVESTRNRQPIALLGKVYCKADATYGPIEIGDMLTTSPTIGHAMKAADPYKAFGAVIGKALRSLRSGQELIPILIALQ